MVKENASYLKGKLDASAMLSRLNAALVEEWRYYRRRFMADEMARERRRRSAAEDDDVAFLRRFALY